MGSVSYTHLVIEHKHFTFGRQKKTVISREYSTTWHAGDEAYYPINDERNNALYTAYLRLANDFPRVTFGGRLGLYRYMDMDVTVAEARATAQILLKRL